MNTMKAIVIRAYGGPEAMKLDDVELPAVSGRCNPYQRAASTLFNAAFRLGAQRQTRGSDRPSLPVGGGRTGPHRYRVPPNHRQTAFALKPKTAPSLHPSPMKL